MQQFLRRFSAEKLILLPLILTKKRVICKPRAVFQTFQTVIFYTRFFHVYTIFRGNSMKYSSYTKISLKNIVDIFNN